MDATMHAVDQDEYRIAFVLSSTNLIFTLRGGSSIRLPRVSVAKWARPAEQITNAIKQEWSLPSIVIDFLAGHDHLPQCVVAEIPESHSAQIQQQFLAIDIDSVDHADLTDAERRTTRNILAGKSDSRGPFSRLGWVDEAKEWIQSSVPGHTVEFNEEVRQLNASAAFALVRFGTRLGAAYWLKATGSPNEKEFTITATLSKYFSQYLPPLVAARADWNAWVTEEAGQPIGDSCTLSKLESVVVSLAELQIESIDYTQDLLAAGCADQRCAVLKAQMGEVIRFLEDAMELQTSIKVPRLGKSRLREIGKIIDDACARMQELQVPDTLIHNDLSLGNILHDGSKCVFADWAEAYIGNPFLTFQQLLQHVSREKCGSGWGSHLKTLYKQRWIAVLGERNVNCALALAPLLAIASYLYGRGMWLASSRRQDPELQSYSRSLARHMDMAAQDPRLLEALCR